MPIKPMYALAILLALGAPATLQGQSDRDAVLATLDAFLGAMKKKDTVTMAQYTDSLTRMTLLRPAPNGTRVVMLRATDFMRAVANPNQPAFEEPIRNPVVQIDGDLASVWAEYQVRRDGAVTHCGYDAFHLARTGGKWKILNVSDTFKQSGCGAAWPDQGKD
ncbi:MAG: nuclear transport factor 2 family protein [Gemmatimonadota bacterium]